MFADPTLDDFTRRLNWHVTQRKGDCANGINAIARKFAAAGRHRSGSCATSILAVIEANLDDTADAILGELRRALDTTSLGKTALRKEAERALWSFLFEAKYLFRPHQVDSPPITHRVTQLDGQLRFLLRQFDVGLSQPIEPETAPTMANSINIGLMSGGSFQQGTGNIIHNTSVKINVAAARDALGSLEAALAETGISSACRDDVQSDLDTIKAQLTKREPSRSITAEAAKSIRNVVEGISAGMLTPPAMAAAAALWTALGI
jgi:hypothetical protein